MKNATADLRIEVVMAPFGRGPISRAGAPALVPVSQFGVASGTTFQAIVFLVG